MLTVTALPFSKLAGAAALVALAACTPPSKNLDLLEGPPIEDVVTPIDQALHCLDNRISNKLAFSVGPIPDLTGRESYNDGGAGKYVSQGAADIVQSALFKSGVTIVNRRSMGIPQTEARWGLRDIKGQMPVNLFISGSVNTLDFIPGGGMSLGVRGVGPQYRQNRILVGMDLAVTNAANGQVVANIPLQKQIFSDETGAFTHRFFGTTLVNMDAGVQRREALNMALRQMLYLATYELLTQLMPPEKYEECSALIADDVGAVSGTKDVGRTAGHAAGCPRCGNGRGPGRRRCRRSRSRGRRRSRTRRPQRKRPTPRLRRSQPPRRRPRRPPLQRPCPKQTRRPPGRPPRRPARRIRRPPPGPRPPQTSRHCPPGPLSTAQPPLSGPSIAN